MQVDRKEFPDCRPKKRRQILTAHLFSTLDQVREISEQWKDLYNEYRPHDALGRIPPAMYMRKLKLENSSLELST